MDTGSRAEVGDGGGTRLQSRPALHHRPGPRGQEQVLQLCHLASGLCHSPAGWRAEGATGANTFPRNTAVVVVLGEGRTWNVLSCVLVKARFALGRLPGETRPNRPFQ